MSIREIIVKKDLGSRDCALIVQHAMRYNSDILLEMGVKKINCKSVMGMISLGLKAGDKLILITKGDDEIVAINDMTDVFVKL